MASSGASYEPGSLNIVSAADYGVVGIGDRTAALQWFFDNVVTPGTEVLFGKGTLRIDGTVTCGASDVVLRFRQGFTWDRSNTSTPFASALVCSGDRVTIKGRGKILGPATWDGTNVQWTAGTVHLTGTDPTVRELQLVNVPKVGIGFSNANGTCRVTDTAITGNYPAGQWTGVETAHFGIAYDPGTSTDARLRARGNRVDGCVQAIFLGNYGSGGSSGSVVSKNILTECWNHGVYDAGGCTEITVSGNTFRDCSLPVALTDSGHIVTYNTMTTTGTGGYLNQACSIAMRNATDCIVSHNVMKGDLSPSSAAIDFFHVSGGTTCSGNMVHGNRITVTGVNAGYAIRVGTTATATWANNTISENIISAPGLAGYGVIYTPSAPATPGTGCKIVNNTVTVTGTAHAIYATSQTAAQIIGNTCQLQVNAGAAATLGGVVVGGTSANCEVKLNQLVTLATYGTNVTYRAIWEEGASVTASRIERNSFAFNGSTVSATTHVLGAGGPVIDEVLVGAPAFIAGPGSQVRRSDGSAGATLYIKETASNSAVWRAV